MGALSGAADTSTLVTRAARTVLVTDSIAIATGLGLRTATRLTFSSPTRVTPKSITPMMDKPSFSRYFPSLTAHGTARRSASSSEDAAIPVAAAATGTASAPRRAARSPRLRGGHRECAGAGGGGGGGARRRLRGRSTRAARGTRSGTTKVKRLVVSSRRGQQRRHRAWLVLNLQRPHDVARSHHLRRVKHRRHDAQATRLRFVRPVVL